MKERVLDLVPEELKNQGTKSMEQIKNGNIRRHTLHNDNPDLVRKRGMYLQQYLRYLKARNFSLLMECEGAEIYD